MKNIVVFSGAGLSSESGIPTFRDSKTGLWANHRVEDVATEGGWLRDKATVLKFYEERFANIQTAQPNAAHLALAKLEEKYNVVQVTQNIDDLLERAGCQQVKHLHGDMHHRKCEFHSNIKNKFTCDYRVKHEKPVTLGEKCPKCNAQLRPDVVWFGEPVDMTETETLPLTTDIFIVVGTSAQVHPAATLLWKFKGCQELYFIDPTPAPRLQSYTRLEGLATEKVPLLVDKLLNR